MTDKLIMTTEQREHITKVLMSTPKNDDANKALAMLQSLPMVSAEPIGYTNDSYKDSRVDGGSFFSSPTSSYVNPLYTSPQALTKISADDVTEAIRQEFLSKDVLDEAIAAAYNAVIKHRSEAK